VTETAADDNSISPPEKQVDQMDESVLPHTFIYLDFANFEPVGRVLQDFRGNLAIRAMGFTSFLAVTPAGPRDLRWRGDVRKGLRSPAIDRN
jgi:hypothetical protein